ncbi:hypothetical protein DITRI_Ditri02bG0116300 [Diplodiscus trichospermus]
MLNLRFHSKKRHPLLITNFLKSNKKANITQKSFVIIPPFYLVIVMPVSLKLTPNNALLFPHCGFNQISILSFPGIFNSTSHVSQNFKKLSCSVDGDNNFVYGPTDNGNYSTNNEGSMTGKGEGSRRESFSSKEYFYFPF